MTAQLAYARAYVDRDTSSDEGSLRFVAATEGEKGDGIDLRMSGARLDRFRANPIIGYGHSYFGRESLPIGRSPKAEVTGKRLMIDVDFDRDDAFAAEVERKYRKRFLNAGSIGFAVHEWEDPKTQNYWVGGVAIDWELYEFSMVPLPMDANAVVDSGRAVDGALLNSLRGLLDRLDASAIAGLRALLDSVGADQQPTRENPALQHPNVADGEPAASSALSAARRRLRLAGLHHH